MNQYIYTCEQNELLDCEFASAEMYGKVKLGQTALFWKRGFKWYVIELEKVQRIYRRVEFVYGKLCGGGDSYDIQRLMVVLKSGEEVEVMIGDRMEKDAIALLEKLQNAHPTIEYGKV